MISFFTSCLTAGQPPAPSEKKAFDKKKNELGEVVHKQALLWFQNAQVKPLDKSDKNYIFCEKKDIKTGKTVTCCIDVRKFLENVSVDYKGMIKGLSKTELAAYNFYLKQNINRFNNENLKMPADAIREIENITDLKDSVILKVATLQFLGDYICDNAENKNMLDDKCYKWWSKS